MIRSVATGCARLTLAVGLMAVLSAPQVLSAASSQSGTTGKCQTGQSGSFSTQRQITKYINAIERQLQQLTSLAQNGQLSSSQLQTVGQQISALQTALQQLTTLQQSLGTTAQAGTTGQQTNSSTRSQLQSVLSQLRSQGVNLHAGRSSRGR